MKLRTLTFPGRACACVLGALWLATLPGRGEDYDQWTLLQPYDLGGWSRAVPTPVANASLNAFLPENSGEYVAVWDLADGTALVERRNMGGQQTWSWSPPLPKPDPQETTRAVIAGPTHLLWASSLRWYYLKLSDGSVTRSGTWSLPYLDATRLVPQNDLLYVIYQPDNQLIASVYNTNMESLGTVQLNWPEGFWRAYAGTWMVDLSQRTTRRLRAARLGPNLSVLGVTEVQFQHARDGGYLEHVVLGANTNGLFLASTLSWPETATTYFTYLNAAGNVAFQHRLTANQMITGAAVLTNGWLLSAQFLGEPASRHTLYRVDTYGRPHWQVQFAADPTQQNVIVNTSPPRLLRFNNTTPYELREVTPVNWWSVWGRLLWNGPWHGVDLFWHGAAFDISGICGDTNYFWREPVRPNNT